MVAEDENAHMLEFGSRRGNVSISRYYTTVT